MPSQDLYNAFLPPMSYIRGSGSPIIQNTAGFPSGLSGNVSYENNQLAGIGPDPMYIPFVSDIVRTVNNAEAQAGGSLGLPGQTGGSLGPLPLPDDFSLFDTRAGKEIKRFMWSVFAYGLIILGLVFILWSPGKKLAKTAADIVV